jgi:hypothetical protein
MFVASDCINSVGPFEWTVEGDKGAIEVPDHLGHDLISRPDGHYSSVDGTKPKAKAAPKEEPKVELQEDDTEADDLAAAVDAANVGTKTTRSRKSTKE